MSDHNYGWRRFVPSDGETALKIICGLMVILIVVVSLANASRTQVENQDLRSQLSELEREKNQFVGKQFEMVNLLNCTNELDRLEYEAQATLSARLRRAFNYAHINQQ